MYLELMRKNQNAQALDGAVNMAAAAFSKYPENRASLLRGVGAGAGAGGITSADLINLQKQDQANRDALIRRNALPALAKQFGLSAPHIQTLEAGGKLDEVLQNYATRSLAITDNAETGQKILYNDRTGKQVATLGGEKPEEGQFVAGPQGQVLVSKRLPDDGKPPAPLGLPPTNTKQQFDEFNASLVKSGKPPISEMDFLKMLHPGQNVTVTNTGPNNEKYPDPEKGYDYVRETEGPRAGFPKLTDGRPTLYKIEGGKPADEATKTAEEKAKLSEKEARAKVQQAVSTSNVGSAIDTALKHVDTPGVVGIGSKAVRGVSSPGGLPHDIFDAAMHTVKSGVALDTIKQMRASSPTGATGLGAITDFEQRMLQNATAPLDYFTSPAEIRKGLLRVKATMELLGNDHFNKDEGKFQAALEARMLELGAGGQKVKIERVK
jgi:hypothetical protein